MAEATQVAAPVVQQAASRSWTAARRTLLEHALLHPMLAIAGVTFMVPLFWVLSTSLKAPNKVFTYPIKWIPDPMVWSNYADMFQILRFSGQPALLIFARNTFLIATLATIGTVLSTSFVAYSFARLRWPERDLVFSLCLATMMLLCIISL